MKNWLCAALITGCLAGCLRNSPRTPRSLGSHEELERAAAQAPLVTPDGRPITQGNIPPGDFVPPKVVHSPDDGRARVAEQSSEAR